MTGLSQPEYDQFAVEASLGKWVGVLAVDQLEWEKVQAVTLSVSYGY